MTDMYDDRDEPYVEPQEEPTVRLLRQMLVQNHRVSESGHRRLRDSIVSLDDKVRAVEALARLNDTRLSHVEEQLKRPVEASTLRFTPSMMVAVAAFCASVVGGQYIAGSGVKAEVTGARSEVAQVSIKLDAVKQSNADNVKLQDERAMNWTQAIKEIKAAQTLLDLRFTNFMTGENKRKP